MNAVLFDDASGATGNPTVTPGATLSPLAVIMNNSLHDYTQSSERSTNAIAGLKNWIAVIIYLPEPSPTAY